MIQRPIDPAVTTAGIKCPIVLPQTSKDIRGATYSPFVRAYIPELAHLGIDRDTFLAFIDGLNEAFVAHPALDGINAVSSVISMSVPEPTMQTLFGTLAMGSLAASKATSHARSKAYLKRVNVDLFHQAGLHANISTTKQMMEEVGCEKMNLPPLDTLGDSDEMAPTVSMTEDPRMRRMQALEGFVMPLDFDVPAVVSPENLLKRMSNASAKRMSRKQQAKLAKKQQKRTEKNQKYSSEADMAQAEGEQELARLQHDLDRGRAQFEHDMNGPAARDPKERDKMIQAYEKETSRIAKEMDKKREKTQKEIDRFRENADKQLRKGQEGEEKLAKKIRWVVITDWDGEEDGDDLSLTTSSPSEY